MKWDSGASLLGLMVTMLIIAVGLIGVIYVIGSMQEYYSPIVNGTVDPGGIAESGVMNTTVNLTETIVEVGVNGIFWIFFVVFFIVLMALVYGYMRR